MRSRTLIQIAGTPGGGKTTLIERLLGSGKALCLAARCVKVASTSRYAESFPKRDTELTRYHQAGAAGTARLLVAEGEDEWDDFYTGRFMEEYSEAVLIEGDSPVSHVDLRVFVTRPLEARDGLLVRSKRADAKERRSQTQTMKRILGDPKSTERLLIEMLGEPMVTLMRSRPGGLERARQDMLGQMRAGFPEPRAKRPARWSLAPGLSGIETAQVVVVNVRSEADRRSAAHLLADLKRIREDDEIGRDILGIRGTKIPITAVAVNLSAQDDPGTKKVVGRIQRCIKACMW